MGRVPWLRRRAPIKKEASEEEQQGEDKEIVEIASVYHRDANKENYQENEEERWRRSSVETKKEAASQRKRQRVGVISAGIIP